MVSITGIGHKEIEPRSDLHYTTLKYHLLIMISSLNLLLPKGRKGVIICQELIYFSCHLLKKNINIRNKDRHRKEIPTQMFKENRLYIMKNED